ncbi:MAG: hypothetical protein WCB97_07450, partial [Thiobacillus sp.]
SRPPAEATMPTTAWIGCATSGGVGGDAAAFLRLAGALARSTFFGTAFFSGAAFLTGIRSGSGIVKHQGHQTSPAASLEQRFGIGMNKPC